MAGKSRSLTALWSTFQKSIGYVSGTRSVNDVWSTSQFAGTEFAIRDNQTAMDAVRKIAKYNVGCLVTTNENGRISGVVSERDIIRKVALLDRNPSEVKIKEIYTFAPKLGIAKPGDSIEACFDEMMLSGRHLPLVDDGADLVGMISVQDCLRVILDDRRTRERLAHRYEKKEEEDMLNEQAA